MNGGFKQWIQSKPKEYFLLIIKHDKSYYQLTTLYSTCINYFCYENNPIECYS